MGSCPPSKTLKLINRHPNRITMKGRHPKINASVIKQYFSAILSVDKANILKKINDFCVLGCLFYLLFFKNFNTFHMIWQNQTHHQQLYYWILYVYIVYQFA